MRRRPGTRPHYPKAADGTDADNLLRCWLTNTAASSVRWYEFDRGGHFAAFEQPTLFVQELRHSFRVKRNAA